MARAITNTNWLFRTSLRRVSERSGAADANDRFGEAAPQRGPTWRRFGLGRKRSGALSEWSVGLPQPPHDRFEPKVTNAASWRMSGFSTVAKNLPKSNEVLPRVCGTRISSISGHKTFRDNNHRF